MFIKSMFHLLRLAQIEKKMEILISKREQSIKCLKVMGTLPSKYEKVDHKYVSDINWNVQLSSYRVSGLPDTSSDVSSTSINTEVNKNTYSSNSVSDLCIYNKDDSHVNDVQSKQKFSEASVRIVGIDEEKYCLFLCIGDDPMLHEMPVTKTQLTVAKPGKGTLRIYDSGDYELLTDGWRIAS